MLASCLLDFALCISSFIRDDAPCLSPLTQFGQSHFHNARTALSFVRTVHSRLNFFVIELFISGTLCHMGLLIFPSPLLLVQSNHTWNIVTLP